MSANMFEVKYTIGNEIHLVPVEAELMKLGYKLDDNVIAAAAAAARDSSLRTSSVPSPPSRRGYCTCVVYSSNVNTSSSGSGEEEKMDVVSRGGSEIHGLLRQGVFADKISSQHSPSASALFELMPPFMKKQLLLFPESDDSGQLSQIETDNLLAHLLETEMNKRLI